MTADKKDCTKTLVDAGLSAVKSRVLTDLSRSSFYRVERDWHKADAAVIDAINAVMEKSPQAGFWKCAGRNKFKRVSV